MKNLTAIIVLTFGLSLTADADVWKWVDAHGKTHFVNTNTPIYTWLDEYGKVHYSDRPEHESATSVELAWHSTGDLINTEETDGAADTVRARETDPNETIDERSERAMAEAYYCKRVREIYDAYVNAPQLYKTNADGQKVYLSDEETEATISETKARVAEFCN